MQRTDTRSYSDHRTAKDVETWRSLFLAMIPEWSASLRRTLARRH